MSVLRHKVIIIYINMPQNMSKSLCPRCDVELKMIRSVLLENLLRFCLWSQPTNIPSPSCLDQTDAITVNCYKDNNTKTGCSS